MTSIHPELWLAEDGSIHSNQGLIGFPGEEIWSADDRILASFSQASGGLKSLIFHGGQPQSANAYLLDQQQGAVHLDLKIETNSFEETIPHQFNKIVILPYGWENTYEWRRLEITSKLCTFGSIFIWEIHCTNHFDHLVNVAPVLRLNPLALNRQVNGQRSWDEPGPHPSGFTLVAHDQLQTRDWIDVPGFRDVWIDADTIIELAGIPTGQPGQKFSVQTTPERIPAGGKSRSNYFLLICSRSREIADKHAALLSADPEKPFEVQSRRYSRRSNAHPQLSVDGYEVARATFDLAPIYAEAMKVSETGAMRSSAGGYYFVWGWDNLMGGHELTHWGDLTGALQMLNFIANHRAADGSVPHRYDNDLQPLQVTGFDFIDQLFISMYYQYYAETLDQAALLRYYPVAKDLFTGISSKAGEDGFYRCLGMYPDAPLKLGRSAESYVSYEIGFFYCVCRMMVVLAHRAGDGETARDAARLATSLEQNYLNAFYDQEKGFLADALVGPGKQPNGTYPRYALFPMHNSYGAWLLRPVMNHLSQFIQKELFRPDGIRMVPDWDAHIGTETVTSACWFLHFDLYSLKVFRRAGDKEAILAWLQLANDYFSRRHVIPELQMMDPSANASREWSDTLGQIWQFFALSGWSRGLLEGVVGLETDIGGLTYIPCNLDLAIELKDFQFRGGSWDIEITGKGKWLESLDVDRQSLEGSYKLPLELYTPGKHQLTIKRSERQPATPILLEAIGAGIYSLSLSENQLTLKIQGDHRVNLIFFSPTRPEVHLDGKIQVVDWNAATRIGSISFVAQDGVKCSMKALSAEP